MLLERRKGSYEAEDQKATSEEPAEGESSAELGAATRAFM